MKKFLLFTFVILFFTFLCIFLTEKTDVLGLRNIPFDPIFENKGDHVVISWKRLPYPCFYRIEALSKTTGLVEGEPEYHAFESELTFKASYEMPATPIPMYYRITAFGMFGQLTHPSNVVENPNFKEPLRPRPIFEYTKDHPASRKPFLIWHSIPGAVCYELEILSDKPDAEGGTVMSRKNHLYSTRQIFTNGYQVDLTPFVNGETGILYWRVRALGFHHETIGEFSEAEPIYIKADEPLPTKPLINNFDQMPNATEPVYPVYQWIPLNGCENYEVELMVTPPASDENNNTQPAKNRQWAQKVEGAFSCYDEYPRPYAGEYYWRVRAIDANGNTIGTYSDVEKFTVKEKNSRIFAAAFGDSITHGGGALSFSPIDLEYSFTTYLDFPTVNIGRSGDTAHTSMLRFEKDVLYFHPYNLLILTGSNSLRAEEISAEQIISDLDAIKKKCEANDIRPIFLTLMPINPKNIRSAFHADTDPLWQQKLARVNAYIRSQKYYVDLEPYFYDANHTVMAPELSVDGLHPDIRGKMLLAEIINRRRDLLRQ